MRTSWRKTGRRHKRILKPGIWKLTCCTTKQRRPLTSLLRCRISLPTSDSNPVYEAVAAAAAAAAGNSNAGNFPTNPAEAQGHPIAPTTSNPPSGKKRRNRSRRNTKSQASGTFVGSPQQSFVALGGTNSPFAFKLRWCSIKSFQQFT